MFSHFFIERPRFSFVISIVIVLVGIIALFQLPIALYPEVTPPQVAVRATYPGASADVIAKTVGIPLEDEMNGVEDMIYMSSTSEDSSYSLTVTFKTGVDPDMAQVKVQNRIQQASSKLPEEVTRQGISVKRESSNILGFIVFSSPNGTFSEQDISDYIYNNVERPLAKIDGVGNLQVYGSKLSMRVWLNADKMAALHLTADDVYAAISGQNYQPTLGKVGAVPTQSDTPMVYTLQTTGRLTTAEAFEQIMFEQPKTAVLCALKTLPTLKSAKKAIPSRGFTTDKTPLRSL